MDNNITLQLLNADEVIKENSGIDTTYLEFHHHYKLNDSLNVIIEDAPRYLMVQMDVALKPALIYVTKKEWKYQVPFNLQREWPYPESAFQTRSNYVTVRYATSDEINSYRNLAENSHDQHDASDAYPHATANAETRGEYVFYCKNAIDGIVANESHGNFPFQSWGINQQDNAEMKVDFGRKVELDKLAIILRADYPHDSHWTNISIEFSDGSIQSFRLNKIKDRQIFEIDHKQVTWIKLFNLIKDKDASTFPALTQIEAYGTNIDK
ncbi:hypothetical protein [Companilactobacillus hulinensis]|uniref:hypothetical protein n=1 Tax=Companilactobacillus hulinensis TaxID=2486007 RepID=UPI000F77E2D8|nr:hypothetical protein [Companilactobacillus hulinensis]